MLDNLSSAQKRSILILLIVAVALPFIIALVKQTQIFKPKAEESNIIPTPAPIEDALKSHQDFFYAVLELNPSTNLVTQIKTGKDNGGDINQLFKEQPPDSSDYLIYKLEVTNKDDVVLESGWNAIPKRIIPTYQGDLVLTLTSIYQKEAIIRVYLPNNQLIWTGVMP